MLFRSAFRENYIDQYGDDVPVVSSYKSEHRAGIESGGWMSYVRATGAKGHDGDLVSFNFPPFESNEWFDSPYSDSWPWVMQTLLRWRADPSRDDFLEDVKRSRPGFRSSLGKLISSIFG